MTELDRYLDLKARIEKGEIVGSENFAWYKKKQYYLGRKRRAVNRLGIYKQNTITHNLTRTYGE